MDEKTQRVLPTIAVGGKSSGRALDCLVPWFGGALGGGFAASVRTSVEGKIGADTAAWTRAFKAIRKIGGTGSASVAFPLASTWLAGHSALMQRADLLVSPHALFAMLTSTYPSVESAQRI